MLQQEAKLSLG